MCFYCGVRMDMREATVDHVYPQSEGGVDALFNKRLACFACNQKKGNKIFESEIDAIIHCTNVEVYEPKE